LGWPQEVAAYEKISVAALITRIDTDREQANLSSAVRLYVLDHYRRLAEQALAGAVSGSELNVSRASHFRLERTYAQTTN
jgi:predicted DNA-binding ribbon-helix-helix protein